MSVAQVSRVFARAGVDLDARGLAEALWLAQHLPSRPAAGPPADRGERAAPVDEGTDPPERTGSGEPATADRRLDPGAPEPAEETPEPPAEELLPLHLRPPRSHRAEANPAAPLLAHAAPAIPDTLRLMRALRPLKRTVDSRHRLVLDEEATVRRIAERGIWLPVLRPAREPWLDLVLVADLGAGGQLWGRLALELSGVFRRLGAFRDVRLRHLHVDAEGRPWVTTSGRGAGSTPRSPSELIDPTGRRLILLLTDGIGEAWRAGHLGEVVHRWGRAGPVAILQPLPAHLWERTALRPVPGRLDTPSPGAPNDRLSFVSYRRRQHAAELPVPVLEVDAGWLGPWARLTSGNAQGGVDVSVVFPMDTAPGAPASRREPRDAFERVRSFRAEATPEAYELVTYLSAAPLSLPLMRTVQATMMPRSSPAHLAEILFSGLVATVTDEPATDDRYEFVDGVRDLLLGTLQRHEADRVDREVSAFIERRLRLPGAGLAAAVPTASGALDLPADSRPFAKLRAEILARVAGIATPAEPSTADAVHSPPAPAEPVVGEVLDAYGQVVGHGFMVGLRYLATCAHVVNSALGNNAVASAWPYGQVSVRIGRERSVHTAAIAAWPPHESTFDELDVAILRIEGDPPGHDLVQVGFGVPRAGESAHILTSSSTRSARITSVASGGLAHLELTEDTESLALRPPMTGAPVWRPSTGYVVGMVNGRTGLRGPRGEIAVLPAEVVRQVVDDYLSPPTPAPAAEAQPSDTPRWGRSARHTAEPATAPSPGEVETQFIPLNDVERQLAATVRSSIEEAVRILLTAEVWLPDNEFLPVGSGPVTAVRRFQKWGAGSITVVTAPQRLSEEPAGPWPFREVASVWPSGITMVVNPGTPIRIELTADEVRALVPPLTDRREPDPGEDVIPIATGQRSMPRGQRFARRRLRRGYDSREVDMFADRVERTLDHYRHGVLTFPLVTAQEVHDVVFRVRFNGYDEWQVDLWLDRVEREIAEAERERGPGAG